MVAKPTATFPCLIAHHQALPQARVLTRDPQPSVASSQDLHGRSSNERIIGIFPLRGAAPDASGVLQHIEDVAGENAILQKQIDATTKMVGHFQQHSRSLTSCSVRCRDHGAWKSSWSTTLICRSLRPLEASALLKWAPEHAQRKWLLKDSRVWVSQKCCPAAVRSACCLVGNYKILLLLRGQLTTAWLPSSVLFPQEVPCCSLAV